MKLTVSVEISYDIKLSYVRIIPREVAHEILANRTSVHRRIFRR